MELVRNSLLILSLLIYSSPEMKCRDRVTTWVTYSLAQWEHSVRREILPALIPSARDVKTQSR